MTGNDKANGVSLVSTLRRRRRLKRWPIWRPILSRSNVNAALADNYRRLARERQWTIAMCASKVRADAQSAGSLSCQSARALLSRITR